MTLTALVKIPEAQGAVHVREGIAERQHICGTVITHSRIYALPGAGELNL
jgi:hypothetical protein